MNTKNTKLFGFICVALLFTAASAHAWDYDSGWLDTASNGTTTQCHYDSRPGAHVPCSLVQGQSNLYFITDIKLPRFTLSEGQCQVQVRAAYSGNRQRREDFLFGVNGRTVLVRDQGDRNYPEVDVVTLPGMFTFYSDWNRIHVAPSDSSSRSVWFGDYHVAHNRANIHETDADGQLVAGRRAIRIQCNSGSGTAQAICGNDIIETGEECDDGNGDNTDGCTAYCKVAQCGDGYIHDGVEQCDDGNTVDGDGCSATCRVEQSGSVCGNAATVSSCDAPATALCASGAPSSPVYNENNRTWEWSCGSQKCSTYKRCGYIETNP